MLAPRITVVVHPIDTNVHSTTPAGWRWAVMVGHASHHDIDHCANAAWAPNKAEAELEGEHAGVAACKAARMFGVPCEWGGVIVLEHDPIPAGGDRLHRL